MAGVEGSVGRNPLDPLLMRLAHDYVDDRDLADKLAKLFLVRRILGAAAKSNAKSGGVAVKGSKTQED